LAEASYGYTHNDVKFGLSPREGAAGQCYAKRKPLLFSSAELVAKQTATLKPVNSGCYLKMRQGLPSALSMVATPLMLGAIYLALFPWSIISRTGLLTKLTCCSLRRWAA
jgi:hypothetical protein